MDSNSNDSDDGLRLVGSQNFQPGERLMLHAVKDGYVESLLCARTKWVKKRENDYLLGCEFIHRTGPNSLQPFIQKEAEVAPAPEKKENPRCGWVWCANSTLVMIWALLQSSMW